MKEYATKDMANICGLAPATVRKYAQQLEKAGHLFTKNDKGFRIFVDSDIELFKKMKDLSNDTGMNVEHIAESLINPKEGAAEQAIQSESEVATPIQRNDTIQSDARYEALIEEVKSLKELIMAQQQYMDQRLNERDRKLMEFQRTLLETAASKEKAPWWKFWK